MDRSRRAGGAPAPFVASQAPFLPKNGAGRGSGFQLHQRGFEDAVDHRAADLDKVAIAQNR